MSLSGVGLLAAALALASGLGMSLLLGLDRRRRRTAGRIAAALRHAPPAASGARAPGVLALIQRAGEWLLASGVLSRKTIAEFQASLEAAGMRGNAPLAAFVGAKLFLLVALPVVAFVLLREHPVRPMLFYAALGGAAVAGLLLPDYVLRSRRTAHLRAVDRALPDALDMMVICAEAGLGLEPTVERISGELAASAPELANEFSLTAQELRVAADRRVALTNLGARTGLESLRRLASTMLQTLQYGTPVGDALRTLSSEMRQEQLTRFEARAARLPVLLTVPMIIFILPCVFIIVGGPAVLQASRTLIHH